MRHVLVYHYFMKCWTYLFVHLSILQISVEFNATFPVYSRVEFMCVLLKFYWVWSRLCSLDRYSFQKKKKTS